MFLQPASKTTAEGNGNKPKEVTEEAPARISQDWFDKLRVEKAAVEKDAAVSTLLIMRLCQTGEPTSSDSELIYPNCT